MTSFRFRASQLTGAVLDGRYKIHGNLSHRSSSRAYLAEDISSGAPVVIKMLSPEAAQDPELRARIARDAAEGVRIHHANVIEILGVGETPGGLPYLVLEALPGEPLDEVLARTPLLPTDVALVLARQAALGLAAAHEAGVVHGHVRPSQLFVLGAPEEPYGVKLLDYGLARLWDNHATSGSHGALVIEYSSPEQIVAEPVAPRSDIYSLGVVLFRLFTGQLPFETSVGPMILRHQLFSPIPPPSWLDETIDPRLEAVILNATRKNPNNRYPEMSALLEDLEALLGLSRATVTLRPLECIPDVYEPQTEHGREALEVLARKFGPYASVPP